MVNSWDIVARQYSTMLGEQGDYIRQALINKYIACQLPMSSVLSILDLGCGEGYLSRVFPQHKWTGIDVSEKMVNLARSKNVSGRFLIGDITQPLALSFATFDAVVLNMVLMDIEKVDMALANARKHVKSEGVVVIFLPHPLFRRPAARWAKTLSDKLLRREPWMRIDHYTKVAPAQMKMDGIDGATTIWHRPFSWYINQALGAGLVLENIEELTLSEGDVKEFGQPKFLTKFPAVLAMTFKKDG